MEVMRVGGRYGYAVAGPLHYLRHVRGRRPVDVVVEDLNKVPLFTPIWSSVPTVLLVHHLFGETAFRESSFSLAAATWLLERPIGWVYQGVPAQAVSPSTALDLAARGLRKEDVVIIPNGVDPSVYHPDPAISRFDRPTLLYVGRLKRYKGIDLAIRAVALLRDRGTSVRLLIAGRGDDEASLRNLASALGVDDRVEILGYIEEARKVDLFRSAWLHVFTSEKEGWGLTNLEAGACGTPTVASDVPGLRDSVRNEESGLLVPHGDVSALADAIGRIVMDPELRERLGRGALAFAREHTWDVAATRTEEHLALVAAGGGSRTEVA